FFKNVKMTTEIILKKKIEKKIKYQGASHDIRVSKGRFKIYSRVINRGDECKTNDVYIRKTGQIAYQRKEFVAKFKKGLVKDYLELFQDTENNQLEPPLLLNINYKRNFLRLVILLVVGCLAIGSYLGRK